LEPGVSAEEAFRSRLGQFASRQPPFTAFGTGVVFQKRQGAP
jgi:hypothetical protein